MKEQELRVTVVDMQPITPAVGGGRQRLLGLYHALGPDIKCTYVGTYDWPDEPYRDQQLTPGLREIVVPLSPEHHAAAKALAEQIGGGTVIDMAFADQVHLSPEFLSVAREHVASADVVVFSHPWCYPPLANDLQPGQLVVYDAHNVEAVLRTSLHDDLPQAGVLLTRVAEIEYALSQRADLVLACSQQDVDQFIDVMGVNPYKLRIVPNGAFTERFEIHATDTLASRRNALRLPTYSPIAVFMGSAYGPNLDAANFIINTLALLCPTWHFILIGGAGEPTLKTPAPSNVTLTGRVDDILRDQLLLASDLAVNPMSSGSGTNIKMFDYMAAGLPILTTATGARGICTSTSSPNGMWVVPIEEFQTYCRNLLNRFPFPRDWKASVLDTVRCRFSWERISPTLGGLLKSTYHTRTTAMPPRRKLAIMSTWNVTCGIGEHTQYLVEGLTMAGANVLVLGNTLINHQPLGFEADMDSPVVRTWTWDNVRWQTSSIDMEQVRRVISVAHAELLIIQYHTAFFPFDRLVDIVSLANTLGTSVTIELHDARHMTAHDKETLCTLGATLLVHRREGVDGMSHAAQQLTRVFELPVRFREYQDNKEHERGINQRNELVIGGFGFLRPYKGILTSIRTLALLRQRYPHARYRGWHATYSGEGSSDYLRACLGEAERLGISDAVEIDTRFLPIDEVTSMLHKVDIVLLPYDPSDEGASAAARIAIAAARPTVTSPSAIFSSLSKVVRIADEHSASAYATAITQIANNAELAAEMRVNARAWAIQHNYRHSAEAMLHLSLPEHDDRRWHKDDVRL